MRLNRIHPCTQTGAEMIGLLLTLGLSLSTEPATAQEHPPPQDPMESLPQNILDEILVTATRTAQPSFTIPYSDAVISAKDFREQSYRSTPEALRDIPGVMVQKTSHGQGSPFIRGFTGFRNVFLIDGVRLNNSVMRDGPNQYWNTVDPFSLDRIEIIKGPSSVLYGSDAIGGTVASFTLSPYSYGRGVHANGRTLYRYSSGERSNIARGGFGSITTSFFYTQLNDTIVRTPTGKVIEGENEITAPTPTITRAAPATIDESAWDESSRRLAEIVVTQASDLVQRLERIPRCGQIDREGAARHSRFAPARRHGEPITSAILVPIRFRLR